MNHNRMNRNNNHVSFGHFDNFVIDELLMDNIGKGSLHWWPYSRLCQICYIEYSFIRRLKVCTKTMVFCKYRMTQNHGNVLCCIIP